MIDRLAARSEERTGGKYGTRARIAYRGERENGWHCGHWHLTPEAAVRCFERRVSALRSQVGGETLVTPAPTAPTI